MNGKEVSDHTLSVLSQNKATVVSIGAMQLSSVPEDILVTYSLGSCIGITVYDPVVGVGGMIHCVLPLSQLDSVKAQSHPEMFTDTGLQLLLQGVFDLGARRERLVVKLAGAGAPIHEEGLFNIGKRNYMVARKLLWKNNILVDAEDVGGNQPRTVYLLLRTGEVVIRSGTTRYLL